MKMMLSYMISMVREIQTVNNICLKLDLNLEKEKIDYTRHPFGHQCFSWFYPGRLYLILLFKNENIDIILYINYINIILYKLYINYINILNIFINVL